MKSLPTNVARKTIAGIGLVVVALIGIVAYRDSVAVHQIAHPSTLIGRRVGDILAPRIARKELVVLVQDGCPHCLRLENTLKEIHALVPISIVPIEPKGSAGWSRVPIGGRLAERLSVRATPVVLFVDSTGVVRNALIGESSKEAITSSIASFLGDSTDSDPRQSPEGRQECDSCAVHSLPLR